MPFSTADANAILNWMMGGPSPSVKSDVYIGLLTNDPEADNGTCTEISEGFDTYERVMTEEEAIKEASRCLNCGCGEGCQLCKTICTDFAPEISDVDTMHIRKEECVACGMCFNRCPNGNIEMVNLNYTV